MTDEINRGISQTTISIPCRCCGRPLVWNNAKWTCMRCDQ